MISLQIAIDVLRFRTSEKISTVFLTLLAESKKIWVTLLFLTFKAISFFATFCFGKNPLKKNLSTGKPDNSNELITEEGPGITVNGIEFLMHLQWELIPKLKWILQHSFPQM